MFNVKDVTNMYIKLLRIKINLIILIIKIIQ